MMGPIPSYVVYHQLCTPHRPTTGDPARSVSPTSPSIDSQEIFKALSQQLEESRGMAAPTIERLFASPLPGARLVTPAEAVTLAREWSPFPTLEWLVIFYLNDLRQIVGINAVVGHLSCPMVLDPELFFTLAHVFHADAIVCVRNHPHAFSFTRVGLEQWDVWHDASLKADVGILDGLIVDSLDRFFSLSGTGWEEAWAEGDDPSREL
jgi:hypothetical protein